MNKFLKVFLALVLTVSMMLEIIPARIVHAEEDTGVDTTEVLPVQEEEDNGTEEESAVLPQEQTENDPVEEGGEEEPTVILNAEDFYEEYEVNDLKVTVSFEAGTVPEGTEVVVSEADPAAIEAVMAERGSDSVVKGADISFWYNNEEIEPKDYSDKKVSVTLSYKDEDGFYGTDFETLHVKETVDDEGMLVYGVEPVVSTMTSETKTVEVPYEYTWTETVTTYEDVDIYEDVEVPHEVQKEVPVYETREITEERTEMVEKTREVEKTRVVKVKVDFVWYDPTTWLGYRYEFERYTVTETYYEPETVTVVVGTEEVQVGVETVTEIEYTTEHRYVRTDTVEHTEEVEHTETGVREEEVIVEQTATFEADDFSTYVISWYYGLYSYNINYVDTNGNSLTPSRTPEFSANNMYLIYDIEGYEFDSAHLGSRTGTRIYPMLRKNYGDIEYRTTNDSWNDLRNNIYMVYKKKTEATSGGTVPAPQEETWPEGDDAPQFSKSSTYNDDGTNTIALSIAAAEKTIENKSKANVIVVFDSSGSMAWNMDGSQKQNVPANDQRIKKAKDALAAMATTLEGKTDASGNNLVKLALVDFDTSAIRVGTWTSQASAFTGNNYLGKCTSGGGTNWEKALSIANRIANSDSDAATFIIFVTDGDPTFRVSRGDVADSVLNGTNMMNTSFYASNDYLFGDGSNDPNPYNLNFKAAVEEVKSIALKNKTFYAIGVSNDVTKVKNLVTEAGLPESNAVLATNESELNIAFENIAQSISSALGFGDVHITDGITELTNAEMKVMQTVDPNSFKYYRWGGEGNKYGADEAHMTEWTTREADHCEAATYDKDGGAVHWNMGPNFQLEDGVHYVVTFRVWPSQDAYDLVAELNNGTKTYATLSEEEKAQIVELQAPTATAQGSYALKTNTDEVNATYKTTSRTGSTVTVVGTQPVEAEYIQGTIQNMALESMQLSIKKEFEDDLTAGEDRQASVTLLLKRRKAHQDPAEEFEPYAVPQAGGTSAYIVLNEGNNWTYTFYVAPGVVVTETNEQGQEVENVLEHGYDFTISETNIDYHYGLIEEIINPMVKDGADAYYGDGFLIEDQETIAKYIDQSLTAVNRVKSGIDVKKVLKDADGNVTNISDKTFTINGKLVDDKGNGYTFNMDWDNRLPEEKGMTDNDLIRKYGDTTANERFADWFAHENDSGAYHLYDENGNRVGYKLHVPNTGNFTLELKAGWSVRFINVPEASNFEFSEVEDTGDHPEFLLETVTAVTQHRTSPGGPFTPEGDVQPVVENKVAKVTDGVVGNRQYSVEFTNKLQNYEYFYVYHSSDNTVEKIEIRNQESRLIPVTTDGTITGYKFNLAKETKKNHLYGGYYRSYPGAAVTDDQIVGKAESGNLDYVADTAGVDTAYDGKHTGGLWATDAQGTVYDYAYIEKVRNGEATGWGSDYYSGKGTKGTEMNPVVDTVYYLKEVPDHYDLAYTHYTYNKGDKVLRNMWYISAVDDLKYSKLGYVIHVVNEETGKSSTVVQTLTIQNATGGATVVLSPRSVFGGGKNEDGTYKYVRNGYLGYWDASGLIKTDTRSEFTPFWKTMDGVTVRGTKTRRISFGNGKVGTGGLRITDSANSKPLADIEITAEGD
ncbi:MAG: VWA domain-containing protein [Erysipelotrichaceae bacterium]|nr:VWA domain-containing protein [Erysipelotrichaceae bacterium]